MMARQIAIIGAFVFIIYLIFNNKLNNRLHWALFFSGIWTLTSLGLVQFFCDQYGLWKFTDAHQGLFSIPSDIYFLWVVFWGIFIPYLLKGKHLAITVLGVFWLDFLLMPFLAEHGVLQLHPHWLIGELFCLVVVLLPAQYWVRTYLDEKHLSWRATAQVLTVGILTFLFIPSIENQYENNHLQITYSWIDIQLILIICLPGIIATFDLVEKGKGTPFPYDPTTQLVTGGVYAYIRNPIQLSMTLIFVYLAGKFGSLMYLIGIVISVCYVIAIANRHEQQTLRERFGAAWINYVKQVPAWYFLLHPRSVSRAEVYFDFDCGICSQTKNWFQRRRPHHLIIKPASSWPSTAPLKQVTYVDSSGKIYTSVQAIAHCFNHLSLPWAVFGYVLRLPGIRHLIQWHVDLMELGH